MGNWRRAVLLLVACGLVTGCGQRRPKERVNPPPELNPNAVVWRTPAPPKDPQAGDVWVNPKDGMEMVYIAPGEFTLGTSDAQVEASIKEHPTDKPERFGHEQPQGRVRLDGYWIGRTEVTNAQYRHFVQATRHRGAPHYWKRGQFPSGLEDYPVLNVYWEDARAYCEWAGGRLPSELEWEKAARGTDGRRFPWGDQWDRKRCRNLEIVTGRSYATDKEWQGAIAERFRPNDDVRGGSAAVGSYPAGASPYGCLDMAGNVAEWCADWYDGDAYSRYVNGDVTPPPKGTDRVLRGGSWCFHSPCHFRCADRTCLEPLHPLDRVLGFLSSGFRSARDASP